MRKVFCSKDISARPRREQILDEALKLFATHGLRHVTTRQIAKAVGISQPSLYAHFPNRQTICAEVCCRAMDQLFDALHGATDAHDSPSVRLIKMGRTYVQFGVNNEAAYRVAFMGEVSEDAFDERERVVGAGLRAFGVMKATFDDVFGAESRESAFKAQSCWASVHGLVSLLLACREFPWFELDQFIDYHIEQIAAHAFEPTQTAGPAIPNVAVA